VNRRLDICLEPLELIETEFEGLFSGELSLSSISGGQTAADRALAELDISDYAANRSEVLPKNARGATVLSPYIRHNLITLKQAFDAVSKAPFKDREKFRDELYWQEYARHLYARVGTELFQNLRFEVDWQSEGDGWNREMACVDEVVAELEQDGWLVNQTRMWLASHWTVRNGVGWLSGQERMHRELIDGSRAANLLGIGNPTWEMKQVPGKPNVFSFEIKPSIRSFYKVPAGEKIISMAFVFRNANGSKEGKEVGSKDIFIPFFKIQGLQVPFKSLQLLRNY